MTICYLFLTSCLSSLLSNGFGVSGFHTTIKKNLSSFAYRVIKVPTKRGSIIFCKDQLHFQVRNITLMTIIIR